MNSIVRKSIALALLTFTFTPLFAQAPVELSDQALVQTLRAGGLNIYFRHAATDWSQFDDVRQAQDWLSCDSSRMRQLSDDGRKTSINIGDSMRALGLPIAKVFASPYCRTVETAKLMDLNVVEPTTDVMNLLAAAYFDGRDAIVATARKLLSTLPEAGTNTVIVAHGNVARAATPVYPAEGEAVIFQPDGKGGFQYIARIAPQRWAILIEQTTD